MSSAGNFSIDCAVARQHLSAYHDGELSPELRAATAEHLEGCRECARTLAEIRDLSRAVSELPVPEMPADIWPQLEKKLNSEAQDEAAPLSASWSIPWRGLGARLAAAATILILIPTVFVAWRIYSGDREHNHVTASFGHYLDKLSQNPDEAQQVLLASYDGRAVSVEEAARQVRYRPMAPDMLPDGATLETLYLLRMPCCLCVQAVYKTSSGEKLAIFEHVDDQPLWFGSRPVIQTRCNGTPTSLVQVDDCLAASWHRQGRCVTVVGARDVTQVAQLMAFIDRQAGTK